MVLDVCEVCERALEADVDDRASPVFSADEDVHNPSGGGFGTSWGGWCSRRRIHPLLRGGQGGEGGDGLQCELRTSKVDGNRCM